MRDLLDKASGEWLSGDSYREDFEANFWRIKDAGFWKLERQQTFSEPGNPSWVAFAEGEWTEAMRLVESQRSSVEDYFRRIAEHGFATRRVRIVECPLTPYVQWELHFLRMEVQSGEGVSILGADRVKRFEESSPLPEVVTLGTDLMYEIVYDDKGIVEGGVRFDDRGLVTRCRELIQSLYSVGEALESFFEREVATLAPPHGE